MTDKKTKLGLRLLAEDKLHILKVSSLRGETLSTFVRRAIRRELARLSYLSPEAKKALAITDTGNTDNEAIRK